ncbi:FAD-binding oxidoreductase [Pseudorhizobium sp. NPDC055634]
MPSGQSLQLLLNAKPELRAPLEERSDHYALVEIATASPILNIEDAVIEMLAELLEKGTVLDGTIAASEQHRASFWSLRESIPEAEVHHGGSVKHDIAVRTSRLADFVTSASDVVAQNVEGAILSIYGHVGDGNVHFNIVCPPALDREAFFRRIEQEVSPLVYELANSMGGTFSAEYGIGRKKLELLRRYGAPGKIEVMRLLKDALDPSGIMNPGKVVP